MGNHDEGGTEISDLGVNYFFHYESYKFGVIRSYVSLLLF